MKEVKIKDPGIEHMDDTVATSDHRTPNETRDEIAAALPARLLNYLRQEAGDSELEYAVPPRPMKNGNASVRIFGFELTSPPDRLAGPLVLRMKPGDEQTLSHEVGLMDAARSLGCKVPRVRLSESSSEELGGPFFIMDRVVGGGILRWLIASILIGLAASLVLWSFWLLLAGYIFGSVVLAVTLRVHQRKLLSLPMEEVRRICLQHGLNDADLGVSRALQGFIDFLNNSNLEEFLPGMKWLQENQPAIVRPCLCHGDLHPLNVLGTWTKVTGIIDWEGACIASPELDVAHLHCLAIIEGGILGAILLLPLYLIFRACQARELDPKRMRYFLAYNAFMRAAGLTSYLMKNAKSWEHGPRRIEKVSVVSRIKIYSRFYRKLTGIELPSLTETITKQASG